MLEHVVVSSDEERALRRAVALRPENAVNFTAFSVDGLWGASGGGTDGTDGTVISEKSLKARVLGIFRKYLFHLFHLFHALRRAEKNPPQATHSRGGCVARLAACGAIIPNCDHARKVGERLSSMQWQRAVRDFNKRSPCTARSELRWNALCMRIDQSNRVLTPPP